MAAAAAEGDDEGLVTEAARGRAVEVAWVAVEAWASVVELAEPWK